MALKADFTEEALGNLPDPSLKEEIKAKVNELFKGGHEVSRPFQITHHTSSIETLNPGR